MELPVFSAGEQVSVLQVSDSVFARDYNEGLVHQVITAYMAGARQGSKAQKTRSEVSGSGKKPWKQKGTGSARVGSKRNPIWRKGGVTFAAKPRDYAQKVNRKSYKTAMCSIFSELLRQGRVQLVEQFTLESPKTKDMIALLKPFSLKEALLINEKVEKEIWLSIRNLPHFAAITPLEINPVALLAFDKLLITVDSVKEIERRFA